MLDMVPTQHLQPRLRLQQNIVCCTALLLLRKSARMAPSQHQLMWG